MFETYYLQIQEDENAGMVKRTRSNSKKQIKTNDEEQRAMRLEEQSKMAKSLWCFGEQKEVQ